MASIKPANTIMNSNDKQHEIRNNDIESQQRSSSILKNHTKAIISKSQSIKRWASASTRIQERKIEKFWKICTFLIVLLLSIIKALWIGSRGKILVAGTLFPIVCWLLFIIWARVLVLRREKAKKYLYITYGLYYIFNSWDALINVWINFQPANALFWFLAMVQYVGLPIVIVLIVQIKMILLDILRHMHKKRKIYDLSTQMSARFFSALPIVALIASEMFTLEIFRIKFYKDVCELIPGAYEIDPRIMPSTELDSFSNCTLDENTGENKLNKYYPDELNGDTLELMSAIEVYITNGPQTLFLMTQAVEPIFLVVTNEILLRICAISVSDILAMRVSFWESIVGILSFICVLFEIVGGRLNIEPFESPAEYLGIVNYLLFILGIFALFRFAAVGMLVQIGRQVVAIESRGPFKVEEHIGSNHRQIRFIDTNGNQEDTEEKFMKISLSVLQILQRRQRHAKREELSDLD